VKGVPANFAAKVIVVAMKGEGECKRGKGKGGEKR